MPDFIPSATYDKSNPPMTVGSIYPSIAEFRIALSQYDIKHEREFNIEKSDKDRVEMNASTLSDQVIVQANIFSLIITLFSLHCILLMLFITNILLVVM
jgi:hypothetical protein